MQIININEPQNYTPDGVSSHYIVLTADQINLGNETIFNATRYLEKLKIPLNTKIFLAISTPDEDRIADQMIDDHSKTLDQLIEDLDEQGLLLPEPIDDEDEEIRYLIQNPYRKLGLYQNLPKKYYNLGPNSFYQDSKLKYGIIRNPDYCEEVDLYNLVHPENILNMKFVTDYDNEGNFSISLFCLLIYLEILIREKVMTSLGTDLLPNITFMMPPPQHYKVRSYLQFLSFLASICRASECNELLFQAS